MKPSRLSPLLRTRARVLLGAIALASLASACGEAPPPPPANPEAKIDAAEQKRIDEAQKKIDAADKAIGQKAFDEARKLLKEAAALQVDSQRFAIDEAVEKLDKREAKAWASDVADAFANRKCKDAFDRMAERIGALASDGFTRELQHLTERPALTCLQARIDETTTAGKYAEARALVGGESTKAALGPEWKKVSGELSALISEAMRGLVAPDVKAKKWEDAVAKLDDAQKKGDAAPEEIAPALDTVRAALAPELTALADGAIGKNDAAKTLERIDALERVVKWQALSGEAAAIAADRAVPADVQKKRDALATWVEASRLHLKPAKKVEKRFVWGKIALRPATSADAPSKRDLDPSSEVWVLGDTKDLALVALAAPAGDALGDRIAAAAGWMPKDRLATEATTDWVPPDDQLKGVMVWAPLRAPDPLYELGLVTDVNGKDVSVKRVADDKIVTVKKSVLRTGKLTVGLQLVTYCTKKDQIAKVTQVLPAGRGVVLECEGGSTKQELLPSLRSKPELLPKGKP